MLVAISVVTVAATSCGNTAPTVQAETKPKAPIPLPAGRYPSKISKQVCSGEAQRDIAETLGVKAVVQTPTWVDHLYSCQYQYPNGSMVLSVKELSSWSQTKGYFAMLGQQLGNVGSLGNLGQGAFTTSNGSVVVRKDWKVLLVNITGLPAQFGVPPTSRGDIADTVSDVILGCWAGD
jgi:hypothetical protein